MDLYQLRYLIKEQENLIFEYLQSIGRHEKDRNRGVPSAIVDLRIADEQARIDSAEAEINRLKQELSNTENSLGMQISSVNSTIESNNSAQREPIFSFRTLLGSTFADFSQYSIDIGNFFLAKQLSLRCMLAECYQQEKRSDREIVNICLKGVAASDIFFILIAHWYGWIPNGYDRSLADLEYEAARIARADGKQRIIKVFFPKGPSEVDEDLKSSADQLIRERKYDSVLHSERLKQFQILASTRWNEVRYFSTRQELLNEAIIALYESRDVLQGVAKGEISIDSEYTSLAEIDHKHLGEIGRGNLIDAAVGALENCEAVSESPILALMISGAKNAGHSYFLKSLINHSEFKRGRRLREGSLNTCPKLYGNYSSAKLVQWAADILGLRGINLLQSPQDLAHRIYPALKLQRMYMVIDEIDRFPGGIELFITDFWLPLNQALQELNRQDPVDHALTIFLINYAPELEGLSDHVTHYLAEDTDFRKIVIMNLKSIERKHLQFWLTKMHIPKAQHDSLIEECLVDPYTGKEDGTPEEVYKRLRRIIKWE